MTIYNKEIRVNILNNMVQVRHQSEEAKQEKIDKFMDIKIKLLCKEKEKYNKNYKRNLGKILVIYDEQCLHVPNKQRTVINLKKKSKQKNR